LLKSSVKSCLVELDNGESATTGKTNFAFNNVVVEHVGSITRNADGLMEQVVRFSVRGGLAGSDVTVTSGATTWIKVPIGPDHAVEDRTA
jgi:hypothetical protein